MCYVLLEYWDSYITTDLELLHYSLLQVLFATGSFTLCLRDVVVRCREQMSIFRDGMLVRVRDRKLHTLSA